MSSLGEHLQKLTRMQCNFLVNEEHERFLNVHYRLNDKNLTYFFSYNYFNYKGCRSHSFFIQATVYTSTLFYTLYIVLQRKLSEPINSDDLKNLILCSVFQDVNAMQSCNLHIRCSFSNICCFWLKRLKLKCSENMNI